MLLISFPAFTLKLLLLLAIPLLVTTLLGALVVAIPVAVVLTPIVVALILLLATQLFLTAQFFLTTLFDALLILPVVLPPLLGLRLLATLPFFTLAFLLFLLLFTPQVFLLTTL